MNALQVSQCRTCQRYDEDLDQHGVCIECEDQLQAIEDDFYDDWDSYMNTRINVDNEDPFMDLESDYDPFENDWSTFETESSELCWGDGCGEYDEWPIYSNMREWDEEPEVDEVDARLIMD